MARGPWIWCKGCGEGKMYIKEYDKGPSYVCEKCGIELPMNVIHTAESVEQIICLEYIRRLVKVAEKLFSVVHFGTGFPNLVVQEQIPQDQPRDERFLPRGQFPRMTVRGYDARYGEMHDEAVIELPQAWADILGGNRIRATLWESFRYIRVELLDCYIQDATERERVVRRYLLIGDNLVDEDIQQ